MKQSRCMSLVEALANVAVGYGVAVATQIVVFPLFGLRASLSETLAIGAIFTLVSIARSYVLRRAFEAIRVANAGHSNRCRGADQAEVPDFSTGAASR
jgi:hypothetical protein